MTSRADTGRKTLQMRISSAEYDTIEKKATELGLAISQYLRIVCLKAELPKELIPIAKKTKLPKTTVRDSMIQMRVSEEEYNTIKNRAAICGFSLSKFMRLYCLYAVFKIEIRLPL